MDKDCLSMIIEIKIPQLKHKEFLQTMFSIISDIRLEEGCLRYRIHKDVEIEDLILLEMEWGSKDAIERHLQSKNFRIILGAMKTLLTIPVIKIRDISPFQEDGFVRSLENMMKY